MKIPQKSKLNSTGKKVRQTVELDPDDAMSADEYSRPKEDGEHFTTYLPSVGSNNDYNARPQRDGQVQVFNSSARKGF